MAQEAARLRELYRYYLPWVERFGIPPQYALDSINDQGAVGHVPHSSRDKSLIAFAQLGCLRLRVKRAVVTLIDGSKQHILAEATQTLSLMDDSRHSDRDGIWFGTASLPRRVGVSENALFPEKYNATAADEEPFSAPAFVVEDIGKLQNYQDRKYTGNGVSFYAGVPITTSHGHPIGVYAVTDDKPRHGLTPAELSFMVDMAKIVMDHFEVVRNDRARARGERLIRGIGTFIGGETNSDSKSPAAEKMDTEQDKPRLDSNQGDPEAPTLKDEEDFSKTTSDSAQPGYPKEENRSSNEPKVAIQDNKEIQHDGAKEGVVDETAKAVVEEKILTLMSQDIESRPTKSEKTAETQTSQHSRLFNRAALILRQCMNADGVVVLDASAANLGSARRDQDAVARSVATGQVRRKKPKRSEGTRTSRSMSSDTATSRSSENSNPDSPIVSESESSTTQSDTENPQTNHDHGLENKHCEILASSWRQSVTHSDIRMTERSMAHYVKWYPMGHCFAFDSDGKSIRVQEAAGMITDARVKSASDAASRNGSRKKIKQSALLKAFPNAKSVVFLPLWDFAKERWNSCVFMWATDPARLMHVDEDLSYLVAFGNSVMNEIAKLNLAAADTAKATFLANISHELRSPLHGILGSIEFLHEVAMDDFQAGLLVSVETCCKTLLDTVNHVLYYSKINKVARTNTRERRQIREGQENQEFDDDLAQDMNLATIVEDAVEAVYAGQVFRTADMDALKSRGTPRSLLDRASSKRKEKREQIRKSVEGFSRKVLITLNIENESPWDVISQPGAIGRVIMNLVGNALKYTQQGSVDVSLTVDQSQPKDSSLVNARLTITDTGQGMSKDFIRNHAFIAFSQENSFMAGNGLGLSIVRQIVESLGGRIDLKSQKDIGTEITVYLSLPVGKDTAVVEPSSVAEVSEAARTMSICSLSPPISVPRPPSQVVSENKLPTVEKSVTNLIRNWFNMTVFESATMDHVLTDFFLYAEPPPIEYLMERHGHHAVDSEIPVIILCENAIEAATLHANGIHDLTDIGRIIEIVSQPCGPQKFAKVLHRCLVRSSKLVRANLSTAKPISPTVKPTDALPEEKPSERSGSAGEASRSRRTLPTRAKSPERRPTSRSTTREELKQITMRRSLRQYSEPGPLDLTDRPFILVVDDNPINLQLIVTFAKKSCHPHEAASDGLKALEAYKRRALLEDASQRFRFVLMDISMPVMDGLESTREIRKFEKEHNIKPPVVIIALTGLGTDSAQEEAFESGVDHYLTKPVKFKQLQSMLEGETPDQKKKPQNSEGKDV